MGSLGVAVKPAPESHPAHAELGSDPQLRDACLERVKYRLAIVALGLVAATPSRDDVLDVPLLFAAELHARECTSRIQR